MAYPVNALDPHRQLRVGVPLALVTSSDPNADLEIWRQTTQSTGYELRDVLKANSRGGVPTQYFDTDGIGLSTESYTYKFRQVKSGQVASDFTTGITLQPKMIEGRMPVVTPVGGRGIGIEVRVSSGVNRKFLRITASAFQPNQSTDSFTLDQDGLTGNLFGGSPNEVWADVVPPVGADLTGFRAYANNGSSDVGLNLAIFRMTSTGAVSAIVSGITPTGVGFVSAGSTLATLSPVTTGYTYMARVRLVNSTGGVNRVRLRWVDVLYRVPSLNVGI